MSDREDERLKRNGVINMGKKELTITVNYGPLSRRTSFYATCEATNEEKDAFVGKLYNILDEMFPEE